MITGIEIRNQQFKKKVRGYDEEEVRNFLTQIAIDYENMYSENAQLRENINRVQYELEKYRKMEETMNSSLILAQQTAESLKASARREANVYLDEARLKITRILSVYQDVLKRLNIFSVEFKAQLNSQIEMLDNNQHKMNELSDFFYGRGLKELLEGMEKVTLEDESDAQHNRV
jgi:cell division initiation protein